MSEGQGGGGGRLSAREASELSRQVAELGRVGLPLPSGLRALAEEVKAGRLRRALEDLAGAVEAGRPLDEAFAALGDRLPAHLRGLILAGVRTGRLGEALERSARHQDLVAELRRGLALSLAYPLALLGGVLVLGLFVARMIVAPMIGMPLIETFTKSGINLPWATTILIRSSTAITEVGSLITAGAVLGLILVALGAGTLGRGPWGRTLTSGVPLFGPLWRWSALADFARLLALLLEGEVPLPEALGLTGEGLRDRDVEATCRGLRAEVERGRPLSEAIALRRELPSGLARLVGWAETTRALPGALALAGDIYEARARAQARFVAVACNCLVIVAILCGAIFLICALILPLTQLIHWMAG